MGTCLSLGCEDQTQETGAENIMQNAKRLRSRDVSVGGADGVEQKPSMYVTTLRDQVAGTPRRKAVRRRSLRPDRLKNVPLPADFQDEGLTATAAPEPSMPATLVSIDTLTRTTNLEALGEETTEKEADPVQPIGSPLSDDIDEAFSSPLSSDHVEEDQSIPRESPGISSPKIAYEGRPTADGHEGEPAGTSSAEGIHSPRALPDQDTATLRISPESAEGTNNEASSDSSQVGDGPGSGHQTEQQSSAETESPEEKQPKRREYREKVSSYASTRLRQSLRRSSRRSLVKKDTVAKHGTAESTNWPPTVIETPEIKDQIEQSASSPSSVADQGSSESPSQDRSAQRPSYCVSDEKEPGSALGFTEIRESRRVDEDRGDADLFMPLKSSQEDIDANARASDESGPVGGPLVIHNDDCLSTDESGPSDHVIGNATVEQLPGDAIDAERHDVDSQVQLDAKHHDTQSPQMKTRSGARFSDDTNMLKDFLSRAQARKLAKDVMPVPVSDAATAAPSPRRSQRNALATLDSNSPSPHKPRGLANHPGTPPCKPRLAEVPADGNDESTARGSPVRRSTRKRLPAPAKTATGAPSFIPVRRADGTDPVVLQKSVAQELALVTQTNTRRNKGQSRPPAVMLKSLAVEMVEEGTKGGHVLRNCKSVGWDQKLVYYQDGTEAIVEVDSQKEEKRPKARRLRGLGTGNGTPAPKRKTADMLSANGRPGSKRPGRLR